MTEGMTLKEKLVEAKYAREDRPFVQYVRTGKWPRQTQTEKKETK